MSRVVLAMSGGVDSSVAAWLLREQGHDVVGLFMRHGQDQPAASCGAAVLAASAGGTPAPQQQTCGKQGCCTAADAADARRVADGLDIPFYAVNFEQEFARIVDYFVAEYTAGRTPNPCIVCNTWLKFGRLFDYADSIGAEFVATGHYARLVRIPHSTGQAADDVPLLRRSSADDAIPPGTACEQAVAHDSEFALCRGIDETKDQSYVLFGIERHLLSRLLFPVGEYRKEEIRRIAERLGLRVAGKRDSQEICFVPDQDHARFVREHRGAIDTSGEIITTDGTVVGRHDGFERFTVGQRKGLRVALGEPRYVVRVEPDTHRVVLGTHEELARRELYAADANWLAEERDLGATELSTPGRAGRRPSHSPSPGQRPGEQGQSCSSVGPTGQEFGEVLARWADNTSTVGPVIPGRCPGLGEPRPFGAAGIPLENAASPEDSGVFRVQVKIRYRSRPAAATVQLLPGGRFHVQFDEPCHAIAPGQAAVCYDGDRVLGGGWIE